MFGRLQRKPPTRRVWVLSLFGSALLATSMVSLVARAQGNQEAEELDLLKAMRRARDFAAEVEVAELQASAASYRAELARRQVWPEIRFEEVWLRTDSPADVFGLQLNQEIFSFADFVASDPNTPDHFRNALSRLELSVPIYAGGEIRRRIVQAGLMAEAARATAGWQSASAALAAAEAWIDLSQAREQIALLERSLETVEAHIAFARAYVEQGLMVRSDVLSAEVEGARLEDLLSAARASARVAELGLGFRIGAPANQQITLAPIPNLAGPPGTREAWLEALAGPPDRKRESERGDLSRVRRQAEVARLEAELAARSRLPRLGLVARFDFNDANPFGTGGDSSTVMVRGSLPLWSGGRLRAAQKAAEADATAAARGASRYDEAVRLEVEAAWAEATSAWQRSETARTAIEAAREAHRIVDARVREGVARTIDLLDVVTALREAETRELVARAEAQRTRFRLAHAAGLAPEAAFETSPFSSFSSHEPSLTSSVEGFPSDSASSPAATEPPPQEP